MKTIRKSLAVLLSVLMAMSVFAIAVSAEVPEGYFNVPLSPVGLADGAYWYNVEEFSLQQTYPVQYVYLSNDLNTI
ncbi:MAG: hypothetical protein K6G90_09095 [Clostridia bacterium]|nr:hypothetical protein [Clostridia bacterium]